MKGGDREDVSQYVQLKISSGQTQQNRLSTMVLGDLVTKVSKTVGIKIRRNWLKFTSSQRGGRLVLHLGVDWFPATKVDYIFILPDCNDWGSTWWYGFEGGCYSWIWSPRFSHRCHRCMVFLQSEPVKGGRMFIFGSSPVFLLFKRAQFRADGKDSFNYSEPPVEIYKYNFTFRWSVR